MSQVESDLESPRRWGMTAPVWLLIAGFCGLIEFAGAIAGANRVHEWSDDVAFIILFAVIGGIALVNALWLYGEKFLRRD